VTPFFTTTPIASYAEAAACDLEAYGAWSRGLLTNGVYPPASQFEAWFPSLVHTEADLERTFEAARAAFEAVAG
jgi:glutamate-1-semialdehyde 2,1-aminomutase